MDYVKILDAPLREERIKYHQCVGSSVPPGFSGTPSPISCTRWLFLDANTGKMLEDVAQLHK